MSRFPALWPLAALLALAACANPVKTPELKEISQVEGYRPNVLDQRAPKPLDDTAVILTFSGGGTRAAALADGVLRGLAKVEVPAGGQRVRLVDQIDVISSVSGGSVTSAYYGLYGYDGLASLEQNFLKQDVMQQLIVRGLADPGTLIFGPRIDILEKYFNEVVFKGQTYQAMLDADRPGEQHRPYVVLNATDMTAGHVFSFTQDQFDLICGDLARFKVADAVTASAAFPVALTAITVENRAPCAAQRDAATAQRWGWSMVNGEPRPIAIENDTSGDQQAGLDYPSAGNLARFRRGTVAATYLNQDKAAPKTYIQLVDGGVSDNVGLTRPIQMLTTSQAMPSFLNRLNTGRMKRLLLVIVNARSEQPTGYDTDPRPPKLTDTLLTTIGTPIDGVTFQLIDSLDPLLANLTGTKLQGEAVVPIDFDYIVDPACRLSFHSMATSWTLPPKQVDALIAMGEAMVLQSPALQKLVTGMGGTVPPPAHSVAEICQMVKASS